MLNPFHVITFTMKLMQKLYIYVLYILYKCFSICFKYVLIQFILKFFIFFSPEVLMTYYFICIIIHFIVHSKSNYEFKPKLKSAPNLN